MVIGGLVRRIVACRWRAASEPERRALAPVIAVGALSLALLAGHAVLWTTGLDAGATALALTGLAATALVPFAFLSGLLRARLRRAHVLSVLHRELRELPGSGHVRHALADALADPSLVLAYWAPDQSAFVDAAGLPVTLPDSGGRATVIVKRQARPVAAIVYDKARIDDEELVWTSGAAAALWLENERLQAELRATIVELRASRGRLVHAGDAARRRIERDLHDGAQQRLVSLLLAVKLESRRLGAEAGPAAALIGSVERGLTESLEELHALATGIMPPVLTDSGLASAVRELADRMPIDTALEQLPAERLPLDVEIAAYFVVSEALTNVVKHAQANQAAVRIAREPARLVVEVSDDGVGGAHRDRGSGLRGLADRLAALDGRLHVETAPGSGTRVRGEIQLPVTIGPSASASRLGHGPRVAMTGGNPERRTPPHAFSLGVRCPGSHAPPARSCAGTATGQPAPRLPFTSLMPVPSGAPQRGST